MGNHVYQLTKSIFLVEGFKRAAIYNVNTGKVYSINKSAKDLIIERHNNDDFRNKLADIGLEQIYSLSEMPQKIYKNENSLCQSIDFIWFEINGSQCNQKCIHCYTESNQTSKNNPLENPAVSYRKWTELIEEGANLGCKQCQFIGGEPFLYKGEKGETVLDLARFAHDRNYNIIEIYTNASLLDYEKVEIAKGLNIRFAVSLYSIDPRTHDYITGTQGSHKKTLAALDLLREIGIQTRVELVLMKANENDLDKTEQWISEMGFQHKVPDVLRPTGRGRNIDLLPSQDIVKKFSLIDKPNFHTDPLNFQKNFQENSCLARKITITDKGSVIPCIFARDQIVGDVLTTDLKDIVTSSKMQNIWNITKDNVMVCQDCEYRYACFDCRPLSVASSQYPVSFDTAPYPLCTYNPYLGTWGKGVWKVTESDTLVYDGSVSYGN